MNRIDGILNANSHDRDAVDSDASGRFSAETGALTKTQHMAEPAPTDPHTPTVNRFQVSLSIDRRPQLTRICQRN